MIGATIASTTAAAAPRSLAALQDAGPWPSGQLGLLVLVGAAGVALVVVLALALSRAARRGLFSSSRELIRAADEMAEGRFDRPAALAADDPLAPAAAALSRLAGATRTQTNELERRIRFLDELVGSIREAAVLVTDAAGEIRYASPGADGLFGWRPGEVQGLRLETLFEDATEFESMLPKLSRRSLRAYDSVQQEARLRRRDGTAFRATVGIHAFTHLPGGGGEGLLFEIRDQSGEEALRAELEASEARHRTLAESVPAGVFVVQEGRIVFANGAMATMLRRPKGLVGSEFKEHLAAEDLLQVLDRMRRVASGGEPALEIDCRLRPAGSRWPVEVVLSAARIEFGGKPAVVGAVRESGQDRGQLRLARVSETKLDAALGASGEGLLLLSEAPGGGTVLLSNRRFSEILGVETRSLAGLSRDELAETVARRFAEPEAVQRALQRLAAPSAEASPPAQFETAGSPSMTVEMSSRPAHDREGVMIGRLIAARDVTAQRAHERRLATEAEELARTRDLLESANRTLADMNQQISARAAEIEQANQELRTLDAMKSDLLANVSHELQTPLVSIKGYTDMILKGRLGAITEEQRKGLEVSLRNVDRLIGMINNLLNFSRLEREMSGMRLTRFPLPELIDEAIEMVRDTAAERRISLTSRYQTDDIEIKADREKITQVFTNLLSNAVKFNRDGGTVQIDVRKGRRGYLLVDVRDTGRGIPRESQEKIFDRFYRAPEESGGRVAGTGIGLSIVRDILRMHGCVIKVDSSPGEGSTFTFTLPLASARNHSDEPSDRSSSSSPLPGSGTHPSPGSGPDPGPRSGAPSGSGPSGSQTRAGS
jgi:PAS domain S-box-containing protein